MKTKTINQTGGKPWAAGLPRVPQRISHLCSKSLASRWVLAGILAVGLFLTQTTFGQEATPYNAITNDIALPTNAVVTAAESPPPSPGPLELGNSPAPMAGFQGLGDDNRLSS